MKIAVIKKIYDNIPTWMIRPFGPLVRRRLTGHPDFRNTWKELEAWDQMSEESRHQLALDRLKATLIHARDYSPYYREMFSTHHFDPEQLKDPRELEWLPILNRELLIQHKKEIEATDIRDSYQVSTGGSTGLPLFMEMEKAAIYREWAFVYHYWASFGYDWKTSRLATFRAVDLGKKLVDYNPLYQEMRCNPFRMEKETIRRYLKEIEKFHAEFLYGYPSILYNFCRIAKEEKVDLHGKFRAVFLISENLYDFQKVMIQRVLNCPIAIFYGHTERAAFAGRYGEDYIFHPLYGDIQFAGNIPVVTGYINGKTPLIRYALDDSIEPAPGKKDAYTIYGHHREDMLEGKNGEIIRATIVDFHGKLTEEVGPFQMEQVEPGVVFLCLPKGEADQKAGAQALAICRERLGNAFDVNLKWVDELQTTSRGKYRFLIHGRKQE